MVGAAAQRLRGTRPSLALHDARRPCSSWLLARRLDEFAHRGRVARAARSAICTQFRSQSRQPSPPTRLCHRRLLPWCVGARTLPTLRSAVRAHRARAHAHSDAQLTPYAALWCCLVVGRRKPVRSACAAPPNDTMRGGIACVSVCHGLSSSHRPLLVLSARGRVHASVVWRIETVPKRCGGTEFACRGVGVAGGGTRCCSVASVASASAPGSWLLAPV